MKKYRIEIMVKDVFDDTHIPYCPPNENSIRAAVTHGLLADSMVIESCTITEVEEHEWNEDLLKLHEVIREETEETTITEVGEVRPGCCMDAGWPPEFPEIIKDEETPEVE